MFGRTKIRELTAKISRLTETLEASERHIYKMSLERDFLMARIEGLESKEETFTIHTKRDLAKVSEGGKGVLSNGEGFHVRGICLTECRSVGLKVVYTSSSKLGVVDFEALKGATITQTRV